MTPNPEHSPTEPVHPIEIIQRTPIRKRSSRVLFSLTSIFFIFGALLAFGVRSMEAVRQNERDKKITLALEEKQLELMQRTLEHEGKERQALQEQIDQYQKEVEVSGKASKDQTTKFNAEMNKMQILMGLAPVRGEGIRIRLGDNPDAVKNAGPDAGSFLPGIVHDFDVLQVVNELRAAKAEAIAINGIRVTGYTPIRCVGPTIYINFEAKPAPFIIEAIGNAKDLNSTVSMPGGILDNLRNQTLDVKITEHDDLSLAAAEGLPSLRVAKADQPEEKKSKTD